MRYDYKAYENVMRALNGFNFDNFGAGDACVDDLISHFDDSIIKIKDWAWGATKLVIIPQKGDFVIKIPFEGQEVELWPIDEETGEENYDAEPEWGIDRFMYAQNDTHWDYCLTEVERYSLAREFGFERFFLETFCIGYVKGHPIYVQEKIEEIGPVSDSRKSKTSSKEAKEKAHECGYYPDVHFDWLAAVVDILDEDQALADFLQFLDENDIDNDLHSGNIGYKNGFPVLMDYAGFYD